MTDATLTGQAARLVVTLERWIDGTLPAPEVPALAADCAALADALDALAVSSAEAGR